MWIVSQNNNKSLRSSDFLDFELQKEEEDRIASEKLASTIFTTSGLGPMDGMMPPLSPNARSKVLWIGSLYSYHLI